MACLIFYLCGMIDGLVIARVLDKLLAKGKRASVSSAIGSARTAKDRLVALLGKTVSVLLVVVLMYGGAAAAADAPNATLTIAINNCDNQQGHVLVRLFAKDNAANFGFDKPSTQELATAIDSNGSSVATFSQLPVGEYAVVAYHDNDDSKRMETNFFGLYKKRYGFSGGARSADYNAAKFTLTSDSKIFITLH